MNKKEISASVLTAIAILSLKVSPVQSEPVINIQVSNHKLTPISLGENISVIAQSERKNPWTTFEFNDQGIYQQGYSISCYGNTESDFFLNLGKNTITVRQGDAFETATIDVSENE